MQRLPLILLSACLLLASCQKESQVDKATREGILLIGNSADPKSFDPQVVTGVIESNLNRALFEGLVNSHPSEDLTAAPGVAYEFTPDETYTVWTAKLRQDAKWSDGKPVTAEDFAFAYERILTPDLGAKYAAMLYFIEGASRFNQDLRGEILFIVNRDQMVPADLAARINFHGEPDTDISILGKDPKWQELKTDIERILWLRWKGLDPLSKEQLNWIAHNPLERFKWPDDVTPETAKHVLGRLAEVSGKNLWSVAKVGVEVLDAQTLRITLRGPTPYFKEVLKHPTWNPVPKHEVLKYGKIGQIANPWSKPHRLVSNGPFRIKSYRRNDHIEVEANPYYWDAKNVKLKGIRFLPISNTFTESRMFRDGQLHITYSAAPDVVDYMRKKDPTSLRLEPYLGTDFYRFNTTREPLDDVRVRRALSMAIDRDALCKNVYRGFKPAYGMTPPTDDYTPPRGAFFDPEQAKKLLAEAGFPDGIKSGFPRMKLLISNREAPHPVAIQAMWSKYLGVEVEIEFKEYSAYLLATQTLDYDIVSGGWIGDFIDPLTFLEMWSPNDGNNNTGWESKEFVDTLAKSFQSTDPAARYELLKAAESILLNDAPIAPIAWKAKNYLLHPSVKGWYPLLLDSHPYNSVELVPQATKRK